MSVDISIYLILFIWPKVVSNIFRIPFFTEDCMICGLEPFRYFMCCSITKIVTLTRDPLQDGIRELCIKYEVLLAGEVCL